MTGYIGRSQRTSRAKRIADPDTVMGDGATEPQNTADLTNATEYEGDLSACTIDASTPGAGGNKMRRESRQTVVKSRRPYQFSKRGVSIPAKSGVEPHLADGSDVMSLVSTTVASNHIVQEDTVTGSPLKSHFGQPEAHEGKKCSDEPYTETDEGDSDGEHLRSKGNGK